MKPDVFKRSWHWLARPGVPAALIVALLAVLLLGALLPQLPELAPGAPRLDEWQALARARYGPLAPLLEALGAYRLYHTPLLWIPLALLGLATLACLVQRLRAAWRAAFVRPVRLPEAAIDSVPHAFSTAFQPADDPARLEALSDLARRALRRSGYGVRAESDADLVWLRGDRNGLAPLGTLTEHLAVLIILAGVVLSLALGWREILVIEPGSAVEIGHATGIAVRNDGFEITRYADGSPAAYTAHVILEGEARSERREVSVNRPAAAGGVHLYLQGYRSADDAYAVTLAAVHDPGYGVVVAGGLLFLAGIVVALYFPRSTMHIRIGSDGVLRLRGWADRRAYDFAREFADLSACLRQEAEREQDDSTRLGTK
jgi:cytochrome c biogenesis protein ResB